MVSFNRKLVKIAHDLFLELSVAVSIRYVNPYWQIMEKSSRNFSEIFIPRVVKQAVLLDNSSIWIFDWNHIWYVTFGLDEFSSKTVPEICQLELRRILTFWPRVS